MLYDFLLIIVWTAFSWYANRTFFLENKHSQELIALMMMKGLFVVLILTKLIPAPVLCAFIGIIGMSLSPLKSFYERLKEDRALDEVLMLLDQVVLRMKSGATLLRSLELINNDRNSVFAKEIRTQLSHGVSGTQVQGVKRQVIDELLAVQKGNFKAIEHVNSIRSVYKIKQKFRRKSGQASAQAKIQAAISAIMYMPLFIFQLLQEVETVPLRMFVSLSLFFASQIWIFYVGRLKLW